MNLSLLLLYVSSIRERGYSTCHGVPPVVCFHDNLIAERSKTNKNVTETNQNITLDEINVFPLF